MMKKITFRQGANMRIYFLNFKMVWTFTWFCFLLNVLSGYLKITDLSIINIGLPCAFTELGIHTGFIVWKSKVENCRKYKDVNRLASLESEEL
jgi:hypothetical protein